MALSDADLKILWSRAAGLCSFPDCRELLVRFSRAADGMYQIGEMAHLVAKRMKGPRGKGPLSPGARDSYKNHILLCPTCHTEIDKNAKAYSVDQLQAFKMRHEHWVAETLLANLGEKITFVRFYLGILRQLEASLHLAEWGWMIDHLWRDLAPTEVIEDADKVRLLSMKTVWPGSMPRVESALKDVMQTWLAYCAHFERAAQYRDSEFLASSHIQPEMSDRQRFDAAETKDAWCTKNGELLLQYGHTLNHVVDIVREELQPNYRQEEGYFIIHDGLGYRNDLNPIFIRR
jgi:hypothetical protein